MIPKILIVEDSLTAREFVRGALHRFHCQLLEAENAPLGLALARKTVPDVILLDIGLDGMDGSEMLARVRVDPLLRHIPVIVFTSQATHDSVTKMARLAVRDYLVKPLNEELLCERLGRVVQLISKDSPAPTARRFEDRLRLLVIDDKAGVHKTLADGLGSTGWEILFKATLAEGLETWKTEPLDVVLISTSLPDHQNQQSAAAVRAAHDARPIPVVALVAAHAGEPGETPDPLPDYDAACDKPVDCERLKDTLARLLKLDRAASFFELKQGVLFVRCPHGPETTLGEHVLKALPDKLTQAIDAGVTKLAIDLVGIKKAEPKLLRLVVGIVDMCQQVGVEAAIVAPQNVVTQCSRYEEAQRWTFYQTYEAILAAWTEPVAAA